MYYDTLLEIERQHNQAITQQWLYILLAFVFALIGAGLLIAILFGYPTLGWGIGFVLGAVLLLYRACLKGDDVVRIEKRIREIDETVVSA